jgi:N-acetylglutamate synthase-like GNAT family acetyltransferase
VIRPCREEEFSEILTIINDGAEAFRGVIPPDRWHDPYMPAEILSSEIQAGVKFWGSEQDGRLSGVMGIQQVRDVALIRHAYVRTLNQGHGIGTELLVHLQKMSARPLLVGTWAAARWAVRFYEQHGFTQVDRDEKDRLLRSYWNIPERQIETSVVLADDRWHREKTGPSR